MTVDRDQFDGLPQDLPDQIERMNHALTIPEYAEILSCSSKQLYKLASTNRLPHYRIGSLIRLSPRDAAQWLRSRRCGPRHILPPRAGSGIGGPGRDQKNHPEIGRSRISAAVSVNAKRGVRRADEREGRND